MVCKILSYEENDKIVDIQDKDVHFTIRKYEKINPKEAAIITTELIVFSGASFFAPGVDIAYFFTKGAIQRQKHYSWFKAGVRNAYDNSILWFGLKGKPIRLAANDEIRLKPIERNKAHNLSAKVEYRKNKVAFREEKAFEKEEIKEIKEEIKLERKLEKHENNIEKQNKLFLKYFDKIAKRRNKLETRFARTELREEHKILEDEITQIKYALRKETRLARKMQKHAPVDSSVILANDESINNEAEVELHAAGKILFEEYHEQPKDYLQQYYSSLYEN